LSSPTFIHHLDSEIDTELESTMSDTFAAPLLGVPSAASVDLSLSLSLLSFDLLFTIFTPTNPPLLFVLPVVGVDDLRFSKEGLGFSGRFRRGSDSVDLGGLDDPRADEGDGAPGTVGGGFMGSEG